MNKLQTAGFLTPEEIKEFQRLVFEIKGIKLTDAEAEDQGMRLVLIEEEYIKFKLQKGV